MSTTAPSNTGQQPTRQLTGQPPPYPHRPSFRAALYTAEAELGGVRSFAEVGAFGGDRIAVARAVLADAEIIVLDGHRSTPLEQPGPYQSTLTCPRALTIRNLARHGIDARSRDERITFVSLANPDGWPLIDLQVVVLDRTLGAASGAALAALTPVLADRSVVLYDGWQPEVEQAHTQWLDEHRGLTAYELCRFQNNGRAFRVNRLAARG